MTPEQIEEWRVWSRHRIHSAIARADFSDLCDLALAALAAQPSSPPQEPSRYYDISGVSEGGSTNRPEPAAGGDIDNLAAEFLSKMRPLPQDTPTPNFCPHEYLITNAAGSSCVKCGAVIEKAGQGTYTSDTPLTDAYTRQPREGEAELCDADFARRLERVARQMAEVLEMTQCCDLHYDSGTVIGLPETKRLVSDVRDEALAAWEALNK